MGSGMVKRSSIEISRLWAFELAPSKMSVLPITAMPFYLIRLFDLRSIARQLLSASLCMGH